MEKHALNNSRSMLSRIGASQISNSQDCDVINSTTKLRGASFHMVDTEEMFLAHLARYREARILP